MYPSVYSINIYENFSLKCFHPSHYFPKFTITAALDMVKGRQYYKHQFLIFTFKWLPIAITDAQQATHSLPFVRSCPETCKSGIVVRKQVW